jgi:hypothetical protein
VKDCTVDVPSFRKQRKARKYFETFMQDKLLDAEKFNITWKSTGELCSCNYLIKETIIRFRMWEPFMRSVVRLLSGWIEPRDYECLSNPGAL